MKVVARPDVLSALRDGGQVFVWPRELRCCGGRQWTLEASTTSHPPLEFELVHAADGFQVWAPPGLTEPDELHFDLDRKGRLGVYWNNQSWIG